MARDKANAKGLAGMTNKPAAPSQGTPTIPEARDTSATRANTAASKGLSTRGFAKGGLVKSTGKLNTGIKSC